MAAGRWCPLPTRQARCKQKKRKRETFLHTRKDDIFCKKRGKITFSGPLERRKKDLRVKGAADIVRAGSERRLQIDGFRYFLIFQKVNQKVMKCNEFNFPFDQINAPLGKIGEISLMLLIGMVRAVVRSVRSAKSVGACRECSELCTNPFLKLPNSASIKIQFPLLYREASNRFCWKQNWVPKQIYIRSNLTTKMRLAADSQAVGVALVPRNLFFEWNFRKPGHL